MDSPSRVHSSRGGIYLFLSYSNQGDSQKKIVDSHDSDVGGSSRKVISIRAPPQKFDLTFDDETYVTSLRTIWRENRRHSEGGGSYLFPYPSSDFSLTLSHYTNPDYSVNDAIRRIISVRALRFLRSGELDPAVSLVLAYVPAFSKERRVWSPVWSSVAIPVHRSFWPSSRYADLVIDACFMLDRVRR